MNKAVWLFGSMCLCTVLFLSLKGKHQTNTKPENVELINPQRLQPLFEKLIKLESDSTQIVNILHIGDSHIQGNYFTDKIKTLLYSDFRAGSKGLVFPFQVAKTNTMAEIRSSSNQTWEVRKNTQLAYVHKIGISGRAIVNTSPNSSFKIKIPNSYKDCYFDEATIFYTPISKNLQVVVRDSTWAKLKKTSSASEKGFKAETYSSVSLINQINIELPNSGQGIIHGINLKNSKKGGISYHVAGVNGAQYRNWANSDILAKQSTYLNPDLIIISLGTNDANDTDLTTDDFTCYMDQLVSELKKSNPNTCILLTTPPDSYFKKKYVNKQVDRIRHAILLYCEKQEIACYDLYSAMGGENSIVSWQQQGLAAADLVHFTKSGYQLQGEMFYESFIKAYTTYATNRSE